ncbi:MAG: 3-hydroxybutyryl-CoA dehydratase [Chloroflexota bacterium]|jgi:acyl dehydratase|nr:3-hydroxybutyryl-CoA dehydratase [Chloroflexota bacterium]
MNSLPLAPGDNVRFRKTVTETDVYLFAGITGDFSPDHIDAMSSVAKRGGRIVHGALLIGFMSTASARIHERHEVPNVSYGYDRVRFVKPVYFGDTVQVEYVVDEVDHATNRAFANVTCTNQRSEVVAVARHIVTFLLGDGDEPSD